jgi:4-alpha-glucanotransferase
MDRSSGLLLHLSSLPSRHGIGDLGPAALAWIDQLARAKQSWWQMLPLGPTGYADSPYQCLSAFAGNPNFISLERLVEDGLLDTRDLPIDDFPASEVDYDRVTPLKREATAAAFERFCKRRQGTGDRGQDFERFCDMHSQWLDAFALFMALKDRNGGRAWWEWPAEEQRYESVAAKKTGDLEEAIELCKFRQFLFFRQWRQVREYAHASGVRLIGDMPIFVSADSADVWSRPELFQLDAQRRPAFVAGVPPDYFSATGQLWGNPLYEWKRHRQTDYAWWIARLKSALEMVDLVRLDHFRGFEAYWAVPAGSETAEPGSWQPGPREELFVALEGALGNLSLIAEDLGVITPEVDGLRRKFKLPGMRILQFAFGGAQEDRFFPHNYSQHTVVYTGTHDNETTVGWFRNLTEKERSLFNRYAPGGADDPAWGLIRLAWASVAELAVAPVQDLLRLGNEARMNRPGSIEGNWRWRVAPGQLTEKNLSQLAELTTVYQRAAPTPDS